MTGNFGDGAHRRPSESLTELNSAVQPAALDLLAGHQYVPTLTETYTKKPRSTRSAHSDERHQSAAVDPLGSLSPTPVARRSVPLFFGHWRRFRPDHSTAVKLPNASSPQRAGRRRGLASDARTERKAEPGLTKTKLIPNRVDVFGTKGVRNIRGHHMQFVGARNGVLGCAFSSEQSLASRLMISPCRFVSTFTQPHRGASSSRSRSLTPGRLAMRVSLSFARQSCLLLSCSFAIGVDGSPTDVLQRL
jgi:hypothetical protein